MTKRTISIYTVLAIILSALFFLVSAHLSVPAYHGVDQNAYLVGGKFLAENGSMAYRTEYPDTGEPDPFLFIGHMWVGFDLNSAQQRFYPKYPIGLPALVAVAFKAGGPEAGPRLAYLISPLSMSLALLAVFFLVQLVTHPLLALMSCALVIGSPVLLSLASNPNSHAADLACVAWGMYFLLTWWRSGRLARAIPAGFFLGYAATIRYTELLLLLPVLLVMLMRIRARPSKRETMAEATAMFLAWLLPVAALTVHNLMSLGSLTGYDSTHESTGFAWRYFIDNWTVVLNQISNNVLILMFPIALAGLVGMFWWSRRFALVLSSWILPTTLAYTAFYWAPDSDAYARFFVTVAPALLMCAFWFLNQVKPAFPAREMLPVKRDPGARATATVSEVTPPAPRSLNPLSLTLSAIMTLLAVGVGLTQVVSGVAWEYNRRQALYSAGNMIRQIAAPGSVIVSSDVYLLNHLQFAGDFRLYYYESFQKRNIDKLPVENPDAPQGWQPQTRMALYEHLKDFSQQELDLALQGVFRWGLSHRKQVFFVKREDPPVQYVRKDRSVSGRQEQTADTNSTGADIPILSEKIAPAREFDTKMVYSWLPDNQKQSKSHGAGMTQAPQLAWQLVEITARPGQNQ